MISIQSKKKTADKDEVFKDEVVSDLEELQSVVKDAIDKGAKSIEDVHQMVAKLPLKYLEKIQAVETPAKNAIEIQERTIGHVYDLIRSINSRIDDIAKDVLKRL